MSEAVAEVAPVADEGLGEAQEACASRRVVLSTHQLTKDFKGLRAVDHLDLSVCEGDVFGFLGPNGAGKTTTIRMILGLIYPTEGHVQILDHRVPEQRLDALRHVGGFVDVPAFYDNMSARRNLRMLGRMSGEVSEARLDEVLDMVGLSARGDSRVGTYSHGMRQRLGIAQALVHRPALIILDEPTSGLDPQGMKDVRELVRELGRQGTTVFLSSHLLHEVEQVCNRAVIMNKGRIVVQGPVSELRPTRMSVKVLTADQPRAADVLGRLLGPTDVVDDGEFLRAAAGDELVPELVRRLVAEGIDVRAVVPAVEQGLEDFFLELTNDSSAAQHGGADPAREPAGVER
ncbi:MAG: ABC transporter ATP-binding protein [Thermoleophilia bacterium]